MMEIGDAFDVKGKRGIVCYKGNYFDQDYVLIAFEEDRTYCVYKFKYEDNKYLLAEETDQNKYSYIVADMITEEADKEGQLDWLIDAVNQNETNN